MIDLPQPWNWVVMLLVAASLGALGGLAYELLHRGRNTNEHLGWFASPVVGAAAALAILYFFPPQIPTVTVTEDGTSTTKYVYDVVKLVALSLIAGSAGGTLLTAMQARVMAQVKEQEVLVARQEVRAAEAETTMMKSKLEQMPALMEGQIKEVQSLVHTQIEKAANEPPETQSEADVEQKAAVVEDALGKMLGEIRETTEVSGPRQAQDDRILQLKEETRRLREELEAARRKGAVGR